MPPTYPGTMVSDAPVLVIGVGGSAGSLEPLRHILSALDQSVGTAWVVVEHHDPARTQLLTELLEGVTALPVVLIQDGETLQRDHIHVAPSSCSVQIVGNVFHVEQNGVDTHTRTPIDELFCSIASAFGPSSVGIVLSGAGTDGTVGVQAIANEGGMTIAQEPEEARFESMPRSAIASGTIDHVLTTEEIAQTLRSYFGHIVQLNDDERGAADLEALTASLPEICDLLQKATEHNFKHYKTSTLLRRIQRRMQVLRLGTVESYVDLLRRDKDELTQLFRELLIGVTSFFRDPEAFDALTRLVIKPLVEQRRSDPLRIWVPGCASGAEAYSIAMVVREAMADVADPPDVQIFATDIDERSLSIARQGIYPAGIAEEITPERLERFFVKRGKRYQVIPELRELCLFSPHNLINDPPFSRIDLISCRNLLIYFGPHLQQKLIPMFHYALRSNGFLFLGPSENIISHKNLFTVIDAKHRISQRKATAIRTNSLVGDVTGYRGGVRPLESAAAQPPDLHQLMQRILLDEFAPKAVIVTEEGQIVSASGNMDRYLSVSEGTFQNNLVRLARSGLRVGLRAALSDAIKIRRKIVHDKVSIKAAGVFQRVRVTVQPMPRLGEESDLFLVVFQDMGSLQPREEQTSEPNGSDADTVIEQLERELTSTREDLEKTVQDLEVANEELKSSNEELLSMNEELQSANEELETSKEEVQSANDALGRAHAQLSNLLTSTAIATLFLDEQLNIVSFTPTLEEIYHVRPSDIGRPIGHITHRATDMVPLPSMSELRDSTGVLEHDVTTAERVYLRRVRAYQTHEGTNDGMVVTFMDVTELKRAYAEARRHQQQMQLITDALPVLISYVDADERYRFNNKAYERWFGLTHTELEGHTVREVLGETAYAIAQPHIRRALAGEATSFDTELHSRELGCTRSVHAAYVPDVALGGRVRGYFSLKQDITDQRKFEQALAAATRAAESASQAKSEFLANMSHEIRTPMSAILGYTDLLEGNIRNPDDLACIDAIKRNGRHLMDLLHDILDLSKIEAGMLKADVIRIAPGGLLRDVVDGMLLRAHERGLTLELTHDGPLPETIESDPTRVRQILLNLIGNAIKFTERGGVRVVARLHAAEQLLEVEVIDTGIGIASDRIAQLFEPFTQADTSVTRQYGGTGLGLSITKHLVTLLGGTLDVQSEPGKGSAFRFTVSTGSLDKVPMAAPNVLEPQRPAMPFISLQGKRVLAVDDRRDMRYLLQTYLEEAGAEVTAVATGQAALREHVARPGAIDVVVLDMQMPEMDGYETARRLRADGFQGRIIALTANAMKGDRERCLEAGCDDYATKPVDRARLFELIGGVGSQVARAATSTDVGPRVLIVDDNPDAADVLARLLERRGFSVETAHSGAEAVTLAASFLPAAVLLDLGLPDMDGYAALEHLQALPALRDTMYVALTGRSSPEDIEASRVAGFHHHLLKPADINDLQTLLRRGPPTSS